MTNKKYNHTAFKELGGNDTINLIWDLYQIQVTITNTAGTKPQPIKTTKAIISTLKDITKIQPKSLISKFINMTPHLINLINTH